jgi:hypothetical protein
MRQPPWDITIHQTLHDSGLRGSPNDNAMRLSNPVLWDDGLFYIYRQVIEKIERLFIKQK